MKKIISLFLVLSLVVSIAFAGTFQAVSAGAVANFPYNSNYSHGTGVFSFDNADINKKWEMWKANYVTSAGCPSGGKRVKTELTDNSPTFSEGMGYGMLMAAYMGDQTLLNDFWTYIKSEMNYTIKLMNWKIGADGKATSDGYGPATDGDMDIAMGLIIADKQWGSAGTVNYKEAATNHINNLFKWCVGSGTGSSTSFKRNTDSFVLNCGTWGGDSITDPSYYGTAWFRIFADYTANQDWIKVVDSCYNVVSNVNKYNNGTGIMPDFCSSDGTIGKSSNTVANAKYYVGGDAFRYWWRVATDYVWFGDARAKTQCDMLAKYFKSKGVYGIPRTIYLDGSGSNQATSMIYSMAASVFMASGDKDYGAKLYNMAKAGAVSDYYTDSVTLLGLLFATGNMPNIYNGNVAKATPGTLALKSVKPGTLTTKTSRITGVTTKYATVKLVSGSKTIQSTTASSSGKFTLSQLNLKKYKKKALKIVITKAAYNNKSKTFAKIKK